MAYQHGTNADGELLSSAYVHKDPDTPGFSLDFDGIPSLTRQEFAAECDINTLMAQYEKTGVINHFNQGNPQYLDISEVPDLQHSLHILRDATDAFNSLPAQVRKEFDNDPTLFIDFATDPKNLAKMREWGLAPAEKLPDPPQRVEIVNPPDDKSDKSAA